eukprot:5672175-Amphidinium_carterae.1
MDHRHLMAQSDSSENGTGVPNYGLCPMTASKIVTVSVHYVQMLVPGANLRDDLEDADIRVMSALEGGKRHASNQEHPPEDVGQGRLPRYGLCGTRSSVHPR